MDKAAHLSHVPRPMSQNGSSAATIAEVVFNLPLERSFHYLIPPQAQGTLQPGMRVAVPFGPRERIGMVTQLVGESPIRQLKPIRRVIDPMPLITGERWALAVWLSRYYFCSQGEALFAMVPSSLRLSRPHLPVSDTCSEVTSKMVSDTGTGIAPTLTAHQRQALRILERALDARSAQTVLVHGVTGSGKTELYLQAIARVLARGQSAICLIPEISLTPQIIDRFRERFGEPQVGLWHSRLTARERAAQWQRMVSGASRIVVGARSAVFAPVPLLGLIILDEEHEPTFKQEDVPRYHARDVAQARARLTGATIVLGSATPSIESAHAARAGRYRLVTLPERVQGRRLPEVEIVDLREELAQGRRAAPLSRRLQRALETVVERGEQAMLLLNRRGFARVAQCQTCGATARCTRCSVPLIYHASRRELVCHYCSFHMTPPEICGECRKGYLRFRGTGTERVESELHRLFPVASIARMDRDTTARRASHQELYEALKTRQIGMLVGTQMIAKGFDFPQVTLVGVISADTSLNLPDFRAGERTFDLLTQMSGRAGRGERPGQVLVQTYYPDHYAIQAAKTHDYRRFYEEEIAMRRRLKLPPFAHLVELTVIGSSKAHVEEAAEALAKVLKRKTSGRRAGIAFLGPAPHRIPRLRRTSRVCVLLKAKTVEPMGELLRSVLQSGRRFGGLPVLVNVDPL